MNDAASPTARALLTLELVQSHPGITAERLGERLGVSERAARRYVGILREASIPIESVRGPYGGYRVGRGVRLPPLTFSSLEALGLVMATLDGHHRAGDPSDPVGSALGKILRALPEPVAAQAEAVRLATAAAPDRAAARPDPATASSLVTASTARRRVRIDYRSGSGTEMVVEVDPWAVVVRYGRWYLLCWSHGADARRAFRVDRVRAVELCEQSFSPPPDLDPVAFLEEHLADGWELEVDVVIEAGLASVAAAVPPSWGHLSAADGGTTRLRATTSNARRYAEQLTAIPVPYRIVGGPELLAAAREIAERMLAAVVPTAVVPAEPLIDASP